MSSRASSSAIGTGPLHVAKLPGIPGIDTFAGHAFHTSRWDYAYTGGDPDGAPMDRLGDKRVAIIGTGATAVQCVPHLARACQELLVFQRTPSSVDVRANQPIDPRWFAEIATPGWQERWLENFVANMSAAESPSRGPGQRRLDRPGEAHPRQARRSASEAQRASRTCWPTSRTPTSRR